VVGQLEEPAQARVQDTRLTAHVARHVQVRTPDVADQQRVAAEHEPRLLVAAPPVGDEVRVVCRRMAGRRDRPHERVAELDDAVVRERDMLELHLRRLGEIRGRARALDQRGEPRHVVRLHVRLEDRGDRRPDRSRGRYVVVDEIGMRIDDRELPVCGAAEQVARTRAGVVQELAQQHLLLLSARHFDRQPCAPPLRIADVEPARLQAAASEQAHRVVGVHAVRAPAVRHDLPPPR
jgi:hypothetical protein